MYVKWVIKHSMSYILKATDELKSMLCHTNCLALLLVWCRVHYKQKKLRSIRHVVDADLWRVLEFLRPNSWPHHMIFAFSIQSSSLRIASPPHIVLLMGQGMAVNTGAMLRSHRQNIPLNKIQENCSLHIMRARVRKHCWRQMSWNQVDSIPTGTHVLWAEINGG